MIPDFLKRIGEDIAQTTIPTQPALAGDNGAIRCNRHIAQASATHRHIYAQIIQLIRCNQAGGGEVHFHIILVAERLGGPHDLEQFLRTEIIFFVIDACHTRAD